MPGDKKTPPKPPDRKKQREDEAVRLMKAGEYRRAETILSQLLSEHPGDTEVCCLLARLHLKQGDLAGALYEFRFQAEAAIGSKDYALAESLLREYLAADPKCTALLELLAHLYEEKGDPRAAATEYGKAIDVLVANPDPDDPTRPAELFAKLKTLTPTGQLVDRLAKLLTPNPAPPPTAPPPTAPPKPKKTEESKTPTAPPAAKQSPSAARPTVPKVQTAKPAAPPPPSPAAAKPPAAPLKLVGESAPVAPPPPVQPAASSARPEEAAKACEPPTAPPPSTEPAAPSVPPPPPPKKPVVTSVWVPEDERHDRPSAVTGAAPKETEADKSALQSFQFRPEPAAPLPAQTVEPALQIAKAAPQPEPASEPAPPEPAASPAQPVESVTPMEEPPAAPPVQAPPVCPIEPEPEIVIELAPPEPELLKPVVPAVQGPLPPPAMPAGSPPAVASSASAAAAPPAPPIHPAFPVGAKGRTRYEPPAAATREFSTRSTALLDHGVDAMGRTARIVGIGLGLGLLVFLVGLGLVALYWWGTEQAPTKVADNLLKAEPSVSLHDQARNGYFVLAGFGADATQDAARAGHELWSQAAAQKDLRCFVPGQAPPSKSRYASEADALAAWFRGADPVAQFQREASSLGSWIAQQPVSAARYQQWLGLPFEDWGYGRLVGLDCAPVLTAHRLYVAEGFVRGLSEGIVRLERDLRMWRLALAQARTLSVKRMAATAAGEDAMVLAAVVGGTAPDPALWPVLSRLAQPLEGTESSLRWAMQHELAVEAKLIREELYKRAPEATALVTALASVPLPKQKTINAHAQYYEEAIRADYRQDSRLPDLHEFTRTPPQGLFDYLANPIDNVLTGGWRPDWNEELAVVREVDARLRLAGLLAQLRGTAGGGSVSARVAKAGSAWADPFTGKPMLYNGQARVLYSVGKDRTDDQGDPLRDIAVSCQFEKAP